MCLHNERPFRGSMGRLPMTEKERSGFEVARNPQTIMEQSEVTGGMRSSNDRCLFRSMVRLPMTENERSGFDVARNP